jgi:hypothetical protein
VSFEQDYTGVTAVLRDRRTGTEHMLQGPTTTSSRRTEPNSSISDDASESLLQDVDD